MEFKNRSAIHVEEVVAFVAHARVPYIGIGVPGFTGKLVWVGLRIYNGIIHATATLVNQSFSANRNVTST